ncbi:hypothetical protein B0A49_02661 [Cryomyces minteri]|uniref:Uncharacterized protein n=1 Tax=Cryomyces minteri TaxID=331657 RepID=A0A4U0XVD4_9PEZI|nr:hypothetical protein B0A49_02661 [Cryomyces minteri]
MLSLIQQLFDRLRASTSATQRWLGTIQKVRENKRKASTPAGQDTDQEATTLQRCLHDQSVFIKWYIRFLKHELRPTSPYQRHITALKTLTILIKSGLDPTVSREHYSKSAQGEVKYILDRPVLYSTEDSGQQLPLLDKHNLIHQVVSCLERLWLSVKDVLCDDAPEGHVPDDFDEEDEITTKDISSYCWRAVKEASLVARAIVIHIPPRDVFMDSTNQTPYLDRLGRLAFTQLAELRHRGAFSTAAQTFAVCCVRCEATKDPLFRTLLDEWYKLLAKTTRASSPSMVRMYRTLAETANDHSVKFAAQEGLVCLVPGSDARLVFPEGVQLSTASYFEATSSSPSIVEGSLKLQGLFFDSELRQSGEWTPRLVEKLSLLVRTLCVAVKDEKPFDTRYAAVKSLNGFQHTWQLKSSHHHLMPPLLDLYLVVYDALNDDDDEIRETAAKSATRILASETKGSNSRDVVPLVASQKLLAFLTTSYRSSPKFCTYAVSRLTAGNVTADARIQHVDTVLVQAKKEDTALFAEEKRNLYIDEVREARIWSRVLKELSVKALPKPLVAKFAQWVSQGIATLTEAAQAEVDGALGWTSKPEVFALGMRVVYGADVLLDWTLRSKKVPVRGSELRRALREFADVGSGAGLHEMWLDQAEKTLALSVVRRLRIVYSVVSTVMEKVV